MHNIMLLMLAFLKLIARRFSDILSLILLEQQSELHAQPAAHSHRAAQIHRGLDE